MDTVNDQYSVKNLLFNKAIPNYVIPVPTGHHKVFGCTDCGDKFILESSYDYHINRKSVKISYFCRLCNVLKIFYNRCNLLCHIRSHAFKTATINVSDLRVDPLPLKFYNMHIVSGAVSATSTTEEQNQEKDIQYCIECKFEILVEQGINPHIGRAKHYMQVTSETYTCPLCLFTIPTECALISHLRFHFKSPPYICPECGMILTHKSTNYPYDHKCEGFMMMRATVRIKCPAPNCHLIHPNDYKDHLKNNHLKCVYKCPHCYVACFDEVIMNNHLKNHSTNRKKLSLLQCELCPGKFLMPSQTDIHFKAHINCSYSFPCWICGKIFKDVFLLTTHHMTTHNIQNSIKNCLERILNDQKKNTKDRRVYRVVKKCDQCKRSFAYRCNIEQIHLLPNECPYKCSSTSGPGLAALTEDELLTCHMCKIKISQNWEAIKKHFNEFHKEHKCIDLKVVVPKMDIIKYLPDMHFKTASNPINKSVSKRTRKSRSRKNVTAADHKANNNENNNIILKINDFGCKICGHKCENKVILENHLLTHKDPCMAYQCMECGQSFVVKPTFSKHLLLEHNVLNVEDYITVKQCYNENALMKYPDNPVDAQPIRENQCKICREQFGNSDDLEKHFRVHGMAFLMKNKTSTSP